MILYALQGTNITETKILQSARSKVGPVMKHSAFKAKTFVGLTQGGQMGMSHCAIVMLIMTSDTYSGWEADATVCLMGFKWKHSYHCHGC